MNHPQIDPQDWQFFYALHLPGGIGSAVRAALRAWRSYAVPLTLLQVAWALSFFSLIGFAPMTVTLFFAARHALAEQPLSIFAVWYPLRRYFAPATAWGLALLLPALLASGTVTLVGQSTPGLVTFVRVAWSVLLVGWLGVNLFFWPLWFAQIPEQRHLLSTWRYALRFVRAHPLPALLPLAFLLTLFALGLILPPLLLAGFFFALILGPALLATALVATLQPEVG